MPPRPRRLEGGCRVNQLVPMTVDAPDDLFPPLHLIRQSLPRPRIGNIAAEVRRHAAISWLDRVGQGNRVLITAGSRGLANNVKILKAVVGVIRDRGAEPVVIGAMGSHGGGTVEGQRQILASLGVVEEAVGAPVVVSDASESIGLTPSGQEVFIDPMVLEADGLVVVNRVKTHTAASGHVQSGLMKMMVVGLGRRRGAEAVHRLGPGQLSAVLEEAARLIISRAPVLGGLAIIENGYGETASIIGLTADQIPGCEPVLLEKAKSLAPFIPCPGADALVVEEMGKNYSGTGMDAGVIGRFRVHGEPEPPGPRFSRIAVLDLSGESHGNANGIGLADLTTYRLFQKIDFPTTHVNSLTTRFLQRTMLPIVMDTDRSAVAAAIMTAPTAPGSVPRIVWIKNTMHLEYMCVSGPVLEELTHGDIELEGPQAMAFDPEGNLGRM